MTSTPPGADHQMIDIGLGAGDGQVVQHRPATALQGTKQAGGAPLAGGPAPPGQGVGAGPAPQPPAQPSRDRYREQPGQVGRDLCG